MSGNADSKSVTVVVTRRIVPGREADYRRWVDDISRASSTFPGHLGATLQGPTESNEFHIIFRYDTVEHLRAWEQSQERADWTERLDGIVEGAARIDRYCGLEFLFDEQGPPIPKYKIAIVLTIVVFVMLLVLRPIVAVVLSGMPPALQLFVTVVAQVTLMTFLVMPFVYRMLAGWLKK